MCGMETEKASEVSRTGGDGTGGPRLRTKFEQEVEPAQWILTSDLV